jgi:hypothetical protein
MGHKVKQALELVSRLERISVDSYWAHRAGGLRVALLRLIDRLDASLEEMRQIDVESLDMHLEQGYTILENAAKTLRGTST